MTDYLILIPFGYLVGAVPFGIIVGRLLRGVDVRQHGSGNTGMTNVLRTAGVQAAILVLALDMVKGVLAILIARIISDSDVVHALTGISAIVGHVWPLYVRFKGGRGTASGWGALLVLSPISGLVATVIGLGLVGGTRYMSLGSMMGATSGCTTLVILSVFGVEPLGYVWYGIVGAPFIVMRHKDNIRRLLRGQERRVGQTVIVSESTERDSRVR